METVIRTTYTIVLDEKNIIDIRIVSRKGEMVLFAVNYRTYVGGWHQVYRVDNHHGFVHEQRLWVDKRQLPLDGTATMQMVADVVDAIKENYVRYRQWFIERSARK